MVAGWFVLVDSLSLCRRRRRSLLSHNNRSLHLITSPAQSNCSDSSSCDIPPSQTPNLYLPKSSPYRSSPFPDHPHKPQLNQTTNPSTDPLVSRCCAKGKTTIQVLPHTLPNSKETRYTPPSYPDHPSPPPQLQPNLPLIHG